MPFKKTEFIRRIPPGDEESKIYFNNICGVINPEIIAEPLIRAAYNLYEYWMLGVFLLIFIMLAYIRVTYGKRFHKLFESVFSMRIVRQVMREELVLSHRASVLLTLVFILVSGLLVYEILIFQQLPLMPDTGLTGYAFCCLAITGIYVVKLLVIKLLQWIFKFYMPLQEYLFNIFLMNKTLGLLFLPIVLFMTFNPLSQVQNWIYGSFFLFAIVFILRILRGLIIAVNHKVQPFYIILYLCSLEIIPLLLLIKGISEIN